MGQLHQVLAVEAGKLVVFKQLTTEAVATFSGKEHLFKGLISRQVSSSSDETSTEYKEYPNITSIVPVQETVLGKLRYVADATIEYFDVVAQKDLANTQAKADLIVDGTVLLKDVPATTLLFIENKLKTIRGVIEAVKTLDGAKVWSPRSDQENVWQAPEDSKVVKQDVETYKTVTQATDKHPAQIVKVVEKIERAVKHTIETSGLITSLQKSKLLGKVDKLINAAKTARQQANNIEIVTVSIGKQLFDYLLN